MLWLSHSYAATASFAGVRLDGWLGDAPCLCVAQHAGLAVYALADTPEHRALACVLRVPLRARVLAIDVVRARGRADHLVVLTDHPTPRCIVLEPHRGPAPHPWARVRTAAVRELRELTRPAAEYGLGVCVEPPLGTHTGRWLAAHTHTGQIHVAPTHAIDRAFSARLPHVVLISSVFLARRDADAPAVLACLCMADEVPELSLHVPNAATSSLDAVAWAADAADTHVPLPLGAARGAHLLCALPATAGGGLLVFCGTCIYHVEPPPHAALRAASKRRRVEVPKLQHLDVRHTLHVAAATVTGPAPEGHCHVLLGTMDGALYVLDVHARGASSGMRLARVGAAAPAAGPQGLVALGEHFVYLGSATGDSALLHVADGRAARVHTWPNLGPIVDVFLDHDAATPRAVTCSGAGSTCSLRAVTRGATAPRLAALDVRACVGVYSLGHADETTRLLLVYPACAQLLESTEHGLRDVSGAYDAPLDERVLAAQSLAGAAAFVVVTPRVVALVGPETRRWTPPAEIVAAAATDGGAVLVALADCTLVLLRATDTLAEVQRGAAPRDVASVALDADGSVAAVGLWAPWAVALYDARLAPGTELSLPSLPCALAIRTLRRAAHLVVGCANGTAHVFVGREDTSGALLRAPLLPLKTLELGRRGVQLATIALGRTFAIAALGSRACLVYEDADQLRASELRCADVRALAPVYVRGAPPVLACVTDAALRFFALESLAEHDVTCVPLGTHQAMAMAHVPSADVLAVATWPGAAARGARGAVRLVHRETLAPLHVHRLHRHERPHCAALVPLGTETYLVVGTGFVAPGQDEVTAGRLVGFRVPRRDALEPAFALDVPGDVHGVAAAAGHLVAAAHARVTTFALQEGGRLVPKAHWGCAFMASCLAPAPNDHVVVGDAMHSLTVLHVERDGAVRELARDLDPYWTTAVAAHDIRQQVYVGADIAMNMFCPARVEIADAPPDVDPWAHVMRREAGFHYGDLVNRFVDARAADSVTPRCSTHFCTAAGALGSLTDVHGFMATALDCVQQAMAAELDAPGHISWEEWRTLRTEQRVAPPAQLLDGDFVRMFAACSAALRARIVEAARDLLRRCDADAAALTTEQLMRWLSMLPGI